MKKNHNLIGIVIVALIIIALMYMPTYLINQSVKAKDVPTIDALRDAFKDTVMLIPEYQSQPDNPYLHTAVEYISLEKSEQNGNWNGYNVIIAPTKLSRSLCYKINILASNVDQKTNSELEWSLEDATEYYLTIENYPKGEYTRVHGIFQREETQYEIIGYVFGSFDESVEKEVQNELMYLINNMR